ncbi:MAG: CPBP family intramembrane metalloprotease [Myxococcaceae bacterium]|nr:CPBP family intramembrane metalloprotease [Myxococcaceae bacterium]
MEKSRLTLVVVATVVWAALPAVLGIGLATTVGLPALSVLLVVGVVALDGGTVKPLLKPNPKHLALGLGAGVVMTAVTYPAYLLVAHLYPPLSGAVALAQQPLEQVDPLAYLPRMLVVIVAEELVFRGAWLGRHQSRRLGLFAWGAYVLAQVGMGTWIVAALAAACGACWLLLRLRTHGLWAPLVAHLVWSPTVLLFLPVTSFA